MADMAYDLAVRMSLNFSGLASSTTTVLGLFRSIEKQALASGNAANKMGLMLGAGLTAGGVAGVLIMKDWIVSAAKMQDKMTQVGIAAHATKQEIAGLQNQSFTVSGETQFSALDVAGMEQTMARMGFRDLSGKQDQAQVIGSAIDQFARAAEIVNHFQGTSAETTTTALAQEAHIFGTYAGNALKQNIALATGAAVASHMDIAMQANALAYLSPAIKGGMLSPRDALALVTTANQAGLPQRSGQTLTAFMREIMPTGSRVHDENLALLEKYGGGQFSTDGQFNGILNALQIMNRFLNNPADKDQRSIIEYHALLSAGARAGNILGNSTSLQLFQANQAQLGQDTPFWLQGTQNKLNATEVGQWRNLVTNLQNVSTMMGEALLPEALKLTTQFEKMTKNLVAFMEKNPKIVDMAAHFVLFASAVMLVTGPLLMIGAALGMVGGFLGIIGGLGGLAVAAFTAIGSSIWMTTAGIVAFDLGLTPMILGILAVAAVVGVVILIFKNWSTISGALGNVFGWLGGKLHDFLVLLGILHDGPPKPRAGATGAGAQPGQGSQTQDNATATMYSDPSSYMSGFKGTTDPRIAQHYAQHGGHYNPNAGINRKAPPNPIHIGGGGPTFNFHQGAVVIQGARIKDENTLLERLADKLIAKMGDDHRWQSTSLYDPMDLGYSGI